VRGGCVEGTLGVGGEGRVGGGFAGLGGWGGEGKTPFLLGGSGGLWVGVGVGCDEDGQ